MNCMKTRLKLYFDMVFFTKQVLSIESFPIYTYRLDAELNFSA